MSDNQVPRPSLEHPSQKCAEILGALCSAGTDLVIGFLDTNAAHWKQSDAPDDLSAMLVFSAIPSIAASLVASGESFRIEAIAENRIPGDLLCGMPAAFVNCFERAAMARTSLVPNETPEERQARKESAVLNGKRMLRELRDCAGAALARLDALEVSN